MTRSGELGRRLWAATATPRFCRHAAVIAVAALALGIVSGAAVRLTGSGLGCGDHWPDCTSTSVVAPMQYHALVEFGNRMVNVAITIGIVLAGLAAWRRRPRRRDISWLGAGLVAGIFAEVVLGGETVLHKLAPPYVMAHFLLAVVLLAVAVAFYHRSGLPEEVGPAQAGRASAQPPVALVRRGQVLAARAMLAMTCLVVVLGTVVTSTGPHAGAPNVPRFGFSLHAVAQLHGASVEVLLVLTVATLWSLHRGRAPQAVLRRGELVLVVLMAQAGVGYTQYLTGDPVALVGVHVAGATMVVIAMLAFNFGLYAYQPQGTAGTVPVVVEDQRPLAPAGA